MSRRLRRGALGAAIAVAALMPVAVAGGQSSGPSPSVVSDVPIPPGQVDRAVAQLDGVVEEIMDRTDVPGVAVAVVHEDRLVYAKGYGVRSVETGTPVDADTVFQLASLSKPLGASVVAREVGRGTADWDDPVVEHLPWFALSEESATRQVQIADLYAHRSGLPDHAGDMLEDLGFSRSEILRRLRFQPLTPIRSDYAYTNFGLTAAAVAVARTAGTDWSTLSERAVYRPLGMDSTSSRFADYMRRANRAVPHVRGADGWVDRFQRQPQAQSPAGGASSSARDMARWMRMMLNDGQFEGREIVRGGALLEMVTPHIVSSPPRTLDSRSGHYALGIGVGTDPSARVRLNHSGAFNLGAATSVELLPAEDLGIIVLTNGQPIGAAESISAMFLDFVEVGRVTRDWYSGYSRLYGALLDNPSRLAGKTRPTNPPAAGPPSRYVGVYGNEYYDSARVLRRGGRLTMLLGPDGRKQAFPLTHWSGDLFTYRPRGENGVGFSAVAFRGVRDGQATSVRIEQLDDSGLGTFRRA